MKKILVATSKPFAPAAVVGIKKIVEASGNEFILLEKYSDKAELLKAVADVNAIIIRSDKITAEVIAAAKNLEIVVRAGAGYDNVDTKEAASKNIVVMNTPGQNSNAVAELVFGMLVYMARGQYNGKAGTELRGKKIGIHAFGWVGKFVANIAKGFGMEVFAFDPFIPQDAITKEGVKAVETVEELYKTCQYISLHIPSNEKTAKSINYDLMSVMPENATIVNTARKQVIHEDDLMKIMNERADFNYLADIAPDCAHILQDKYPSRYYGTPKKMGAQTLEANVNAGIAAINQIIKYFESGDTTFKVN